MSTYGFGVDIGGTSIKMSLFHMDGTLLEKWEIPTRKEAEGAYILDDVAKSIQEKMEEKNLAQEDIAGIGVGVPGPVLRDAVVNGCVNLGWGIVDVSKELGEKTGLKVKTANDANAAALGEMWQGGGRGYRDVVMVTLGTGVGGGIITDGKILPGFHGAAGEIGHMFSDESITEICTCGKSGCLEQSASATGIVRLAKAALATDARETPLRSISPLTAKDVLDAAKADDPLASDVVEKMAKTLGAGLANVACVVDPEVFVIGGGVSRAGDILIQKIQAYYKKYAFHASRDAKFALAQLGNDAGVYGCIYLLYE